MAAAPVSPATLQAAIALNRFGLGARPDEPLPADPKSWLLAQIEPRGGYEARPAAWRALPDSSTAAADFLLAQRALRAVAPADQPGSRKQLQQHAREVYQSAVEARVTSALVTPTPFVEQTVHFWANHFAISTDAPILTALAGPFEADAIRPYVLGRFEDMLLAVERHPAMQFYLSQAQSVGPDSPAVLRATARRPDRPARGLNENLAREIMELHTLGARSGYSQSDVTEFARAMTGWSIATPANAAALQRVAEQPQSAGTAAPGAPGAFIFRPQFHEPGDRTILGHRYEQSDAGQALAALHDFAAAPATATHLATKLACHFVADTPPPALVASMARAFLQSGGDLPSMYRVLLESPAAWASASLKFKTPWQWTLSSLRGVGLRDGTGIRIAALLNQLGQPVWRPGSPAGYDDIAASWAAPDALVLRVEMAQRFAARAGAGVDARTLAPRLLPGTLSAATADAIARADSASTGLALLLVSPDFQRT